MKNAQLHTSDSHLSACTFSGNGSLHSVSTAIVVVVIDDVDYITVHERQREGEEKEALHATVLDFLNFSGDAEVCPRSNCDVQKHGKPPGKSDYFASGDGSGKVG